MKTSKNELSDFELEVMQLFWQLGEASTPRLHKEISKKRDVSYSTVRTIVDRLEKKDAIQRKTMDGRAISFQPKLEQEKVSYSLVKNFVRRIFSGESRSLFSHLLEDESLDEDDIKYLESLLARKKNAIRSKS